MHRHAQTRPINELGAAVHVNWFRKETVVPAQAETQSNPTFAFIKWFAEYEISS